MYGIHYILPYLPPANKETATSILPEEGAWILNKCCATCLLVGTKQGDLAYKIRSEGEYGLDIPIELALGHDPPALSSIHTKNSFNPGGPGLVLFTSGTTGPPKGVVLPRCFFFPNVELDCAPHDIALVYRPVNGLSGILNLMDLIYAGACAELFPGGIQPAIIWERLRQGGVTVLAGATRFWQLLMSHYEENLSWLPSSDLQEYRDGAHNLRVAWFGGGLPSPVARRFWLRLRTGKSWIVKYGSSETGREAFSFRFRKEEEITQVSDLPIPTRKVILIFIEPIIGTPLPGVTAKLTEGDHGELLLKSPTMMIG
jgi:malonyl-CoA/methylmalonyl-CoA synthetase